MLPIQSPLMQWGRSRPLIVVYRDGSPSSLFGLLWYHFSGSIGYLLQPLKGRMLSSPFSLCWHVWGWAYIFCVWCLVQVEIIGQRVFCLAKLLFCLSCDQRKQAVIGAIFVCTHWHFNFSSFSSKSGIYEAKRTHKNSPPSCFRGLKVLSWFPFISPSLLSVSHFSSLLMRLPTNSTLAKWSQDRKQRSSRE